ncbi:MAG: hypothetical protein ABIP29_03555 [Candidatus Eisenbacteria bacterium]
MAGRGATSFLKRQKEMNRTAKANAKRQAQQARRDDRQAGIRGESNEIEFSPEDAVNLPENQEPDPLAVDREDKDSAP